MDRENFLNLSTYTITDIKTEVEDYLLHFQEKQCAYCKHLTGSCKLENKQDIIYCIILDLKRKLLNIYKQEKYQNKHNERKLSK